MQISETVFTINDSGSLIIPEAVLREMGLSPGSHVRIAYLTRDGQQNSFQEFLLSGNPLDELSEEQQLRVPDHILEDANIPTDADIQVLCLDGYIVICQDPALRPDELAAVLEQLQIADELIFTLSSSPEQVREQLGKLINHFQEGADSSDI